MNEETWMPLPLHGFESLYEVSNLGRVRSLPVAIRRVGKQRGRMLKLSDNGRGYLQFKPSADDGLIKTIPVHVAVALAFIGPRPDGFHINHKDGIKTNNCASNLEYVTPVENARHAWSLGLGKSSVGELNGNAKLDASKIVAIRAMRRDKKTFKQIASAFGIHKDSVRNILRGRTWAHVA